jgi:ribonuclease HI
LGVQAVGRVAGVPGPLVLATDGAEDARRVGAGFVATSGHFGVRGHPYDHRISGMQRTAVVELRAVFFGLRCLRSTGSGAGLPVEVRVDSLSALSFLEGWAGGGTGLPAGYRLWRHSGAGSTLVRLREIVARDAASLTFCHERAHVGNILNEAADSLAKLGLRCSKGVVERDQLGFLARHYAEQNLAAYRQVLANPG